MALSHLTRDLSAPSSPKCQIRFPMSPAEVLKEVARLLFLDVRSGDHHKPESVHHHHYPELSFLRFGPPGSHFPSLAGSQSNCFALQKDPHFSRRILRASCDPEPWSTRHTLLWRLNFALAARSNAHSAIRRNSSLSSDLHNVECLPPALQLSSTTTERIPARKAHEPSSRTTLLTRHQSPDMCKWNPNSKHPILSRRCSHWNFRHERLFVLDRPVPVVWCNKCWTVCAFESNEPIHSGEDIVV